MARSGGGGSMLMSAVVAALLWAAQCSAQDEDEPRMGSERAVIQTSFGDVELGFYPDLAPKSAAHILELFKLGCYNTNHIFRVDKGFVAQVADVIGGRTVGMDARQHMEAAKTVPGEFSKVKHVRGTLSMARYSDPNSGTSSFSILLGDAPHLDGQYAVFGKMTYGDEVLSKLEQLETRTEGIFVMPKERITILSTYVYDTQEGCSCCEETRLRLRAAEQATADARRACLP